MNTQSKVLLFLASIPLVVNAKKMEKPNILCITCEDITPRLGCYGDPDALTPNLDNFATRAIRFTNMFTTVGVSAPSRAALITGMYPTAIGANYMRTNAPQNAMPSGIKPYDVVLPEGIKCYTEYLRDAGYYCTNNNKTDYQFASPLTAWDESGVKAHWKNRPEGMPFFSVFNLNVTHESQIWKRADKPLVVKPSELHLPPYLPDDPVVRRDMAVLYGNIYEMDKQFQKLINELEQQDELENTIIIWFSDNGGPLPREKRSVYETGIRVPFMISFPDKKGQGTVDERLCMFPDIPATILSLAGITPPEYMQGQAFLGKYNVNKPREYIYAARDRMDEQVDKQGAVRDSRYKYIRNYNVDQSNYRPNAYRLQMPMMERMIQLLKADSLNREQSKWFVSPRPEEEFYDLQQDPYEMHNLISSPEYAQHIDRLRSEYNRWVLEQNKGWNIPESENQERMWPGGVQPRLSDPEIKIIRGKIEVSSSDKGVSFAYQINGQGYSKNHWFLYKNPIRLKKGDVLSVVAVRAGMKNSNVIHYPVN